MLGDSNTIAGLLPAAAVVAVAGVLPAYSWSTPELVALVIAMTVGTSLSVVWLVIARRWTLPSWGLHVGITLGNVFLTVVVAVAATENLNMANLYLLSVTAAILLFSLRAALAHIVASGVFYAAVLAFGPQTVGPPVIAWLAVFGTSVVVGAVAVGLVGVLRMAATADPLTGLANRRAWDDRLDLEMERARRTGAVLTIAMIDLNGFKEVNDRLGHVAGDQLLKAIARAWQPQVRGGGDYLARIGGDEFAVLTSDSDQTAMRRLIKRFTETTPDGISFSAGEATWDRSEQASDLLRRADVAMYKDKLKHRQGLNPHVA